MPTDSMPRLLLEQARLRPDAPAHFQKSQGLWRATSWRDYEREVRAAGKAMIALGLTPGESAVILGFNRPEWVVFDVACMAVGGAPAGIYTTSSSPEIAYIAGNCDARLALVETLDQWQKLAQAKDQLPQLAHVVLMRGMPTVDDPRVLSWDAFLSRGRQVSDQTFLDRIDALRPEGLATLIYTSGTTGPPKGVMLSHQNLFWTAGAADHVTGTTARDTNLSYLPLSHIAEQMFTIHAPLRHGNAVYFAESLEAVPANLREVQPSVIFGVPRIWEKIHAGLTQMVEGSSGASALLIAQARRVASAVHALRNEGKQPSRALQVQYALAQRVVFARIKQAIGLSNARLCVSGAAPIARDVLEFLASLDVVIHEVYGQSEDCGPTSYNLPGRNRFGSVGPPLRGVSVRIAEDGEILVRGPNVFLGYYKNPEATAEVLVEGELHSGDLGRLDADGFLHITGRKKDILITAGGKNIAPKNLEEALKRDVLVSEAVVVGDQRKYLAALLTVDAQAAEEAGFQAPLHESAALRRRLQQHVDDVNRELARVEQIKKFAILPRALGVDSGELTPTLKIKRAKVAQHFAAEIEALYTDPKGRAGA